MEFTKAAAKEHGRAFIPPEELSEMMSEHGFVGITEHWEKWPFSPCHPEEKLRRLGSLCQLHMKETLISYSLALLTKYKSMSKADVEELCDSVMRELTSSEVKVDPEDARGEGARLKVEFEANDAAVGIAETGSLEAKIVTGQKEHWVKAFWMYGLKPPGGPAG